VTGGGVSFRLVPIVTDNTGILHGTEALVAGVEVAKVWIVIVQVEDDRLVSTGSGGGIMAHLTLGLEGGAVTFGFAWEGHGGDTKVKVLDSRAFVAWWRNGQRGWVS